jgi:mono/diheme cytochrome c family protein
LVEASYVKRALKVLGILLGLIVLVVGGFAAFINSDYPVKRQAGSIDIKVEATAERLARGKSLVSMRCAGCHLDQATGGLTGIKMLDAPPEFGEIYSHNITRHQTKGIGRYTDGELAYLLRTGIRRDGVFTGPFMQSPHLSDEDLISIIAFLRSDDPLTAPRDVDDRQIKPTFLTKLLLHVAWKPLAVPTASIKAPAREDKVAYGRYVVHALGDCFACHSADFKKMNIVEPEKSGGYLGGGNHLKDAAGTEILTPNLTPDPETGIGKWSEDEFVTAVRTGIRKDGKALRYPMIRFIDLGEDEIRAAFAYLKTVPPIKNAVPRIESPLPATATEGEKLYIKYACASCHGNKGVGICDLRQASKTYDTDEKLTAYIKDASKFVPGTKMPTWEGIIPDAELPPIIAFVHQLEKDAKK